MLNRNLIALDLLPTCVECFTIEDAPRLAFETADRFIAEAEKTTGPKILIEWEEEIWEIEKILPNGQEIQLRRWVGNGFEYNFIAMEQFFDAFGKALRGAK